jgi:hypothetical protein
MRNHCRWFGTCFVTFVLLFTALPPTVQAQGQTSNTAPVSTVVTVLGPKFTPPPAIGKDDVVVREGQTRKDVLNWVPAQGDRAGLELAVVIDDADRRDVAKQWDDLRSFIKALPKSTSVGILYANNGTIEQASPFGPDHDAAANALRIPRGVIGANTSIFNSLMALVEGWPVSGARREILVIADGFDRLRRERFSPDVTKTVEKAQQAGIILHAIFVNAVGRAGRVTGGINIGQGNLNTLTDGTGGQAFFQGFSTPIAFEPFLTQLDLVLRNQYFLAWTTNRSKNSKGELRGFKVSTEQRNVEIKAAEKIFVPAEK